MPNHAPVCGLRSARYVNVQDSGESKTFRVARICAVLGRLVLGASWRFLESCCLNIGLRGGVYRKESVLTEELPALPG